MAKRWTEQDLKNLRPGMVPGVTSPAVQQVKRKVHHITKQKTELGILITLICRAHAWEVVTELKFLPDRKFKFDWAIPSIKVGIEYEGLNSDKSRHTTLEGFTKDCSKYNLAQLAGWKVLRYTALNYEQIGNDLLQFKTQ